MLHSNFLHIENGIVSIILTWFVALSGTHSEPRKISKMVLFTKTVNGWQQVNIFTKSSILTAILDMAQIITWSWKLLFEHLQLNIKIKKFKKNKGALLDYTVDIFCRCKLWKKSLGIFCKKYCTTRNIKSLLPVWRKDYFFSFIKYLNQKWHNLLLNKIISFNTTRVNFTTKYDSFKWQSIGNINSVIAKSILSYSMNWNQATNLLLHPLNKSENLWFSDVFRGYRKRPVAWNELKVWSVGFPYRYSLLCL